MDLRRWLTEAVTAHQQWADDFGSFDQHDALRISDDRFAEVFGEFTERLGENYPFFHPRYAGQMLKPPHSAAVVGYLTAMLINPNNHALDGGPATARMEREVVQDLADMFGYHNHLGHLTTSGTIANLEALFVARSIHPDRGVAYSTEAHYTHGRMCALLGIATHQVPVDAQGRMDLTALEEQLATGQIGTVVLTLGTTALGALDPVDAGVALAHQYGARVHLDAAYGGFYTLLAGELAIPAEPWRAVAESDSIVVDPHKHGLQPYGCGAVLFRDPNVGKFYVHDSPYTYFTSNELHLGEISLECSRPGAAAAALWLTFQLLPPTRAGLGASLAANRRAALHLADLLKASDILSLYQEPALDIVTYYPASQTMSSIDAASTRILDAGMTAKSDPVFLSTLRVTAAAFRQRHPGITADTDGARILRSALMKPEQEHYADHLCARLEQIARS
ncbi:MAG TPA: aminotransferase class V-fold PLP-dependent enzyme [Pseudonocardiaceae bacterium]|nr:aminotransferase class V-fold PLP-dependent enzyme [Pseudonocardiaceae bacterium]